MPLVVTCCPSVRQMSFQNFPFDSMDLLVDLEFINTAGLFDNHIGVDVKASAGGTRVRRQGRGSAAYARPAWLRSHRAEAAHACLPACMPALASCASHLL